MEQPFLTPKSISLLSVITILALFSAVALLTLGNVAQKCDWEQGTKARK